MNCTQCGNDVAGASTVCPSCGTPLASPVSHARVTATATPAGNATPAPVYNFDINRWTLADRVVGGSSLIVLIALFLPWFTVSLGPFGSASASGTDAHGWLWFVFVLSLLLFAYMIVAAGFERFPVNLPLAHDRLLLSVSGVNLLLVFLGFILKPGGSAVGWGFGAFVGLIAAIAAFVPVAFADRFQRMTARR